MKTTTLAPGREARLDAVNSFLVAISLCGRGFFRHEDRVSRFEMDGRGRLWFIDHYSQKRIYAHYDHGWKGFTNGGTLYGLCLSLRDFVRTGEPLRPGLFCVTIDSRRSDLWGYGEAMQRVRDAAHRLGVVVDPYPVQEAAR